MKKTLITIITMICLANFSYAGKLPKDVLDKNVAIAILYSPIESFNVKASSNKLKYSLIKMGFNVVQLDVIKTNDQQKDIMEEYKNKNVAYTISYIAIDFATSLSHGITIIDAEDFRTSNVINQRDTHFKFAHRSLDKALGKLRKGVDKLLEENPNANKAKYDASLIKKVTVKKEEKKSEEITAEKKKIKTVNDGEPIKPDYNYLPKDLNKAKMFYLNLQTGEYQFPKILNNTVKNKMKKYPFEFTIFENYGSLPSDVDKMNLSGYKYRLILQKVAQRYLKTTTYLNSPKPDKSEMMVKDHFIAYIQDVETGKIYSGKVEPTFITYMMKDFVKKINEKYNVGK